MVSEIDSETFTHYCLCQTASLCWVVSEIDSVPLLPLSNSFFGLYGFRDWQWYVHPLLPLSNGFFVLCGFSDWQWHIHSLLPLSNGFFMLCGFRDSQWYIHPLLPLSNGFFVLCGFRDWQWHIHPLLPSVLHAPDPVIHSPTTAFVKWFLCVVWFQRLTVTHSLTTAFVRWLLYVVWFQRLTVIHRFSMPQTQWYIHLLLPLWNGFFMLCDFRDWQRHIHPLLPSVLHAPVPVANECRQTVVQLQCRTSPLHQAGSLTLDVACTDLFFVHLNFQTMKIRKFPPEYDHKYFFTSFAVHLFSSPEYAQFWVFGGTCLTTCHCYSVSFCVVLSVVLALNSQAFQSKACISAAKYEHSPFFWKPCWNYFQIIFTENKWNSGEKKKNLTLFSIL